MALISWLVRDMMEAVRPEKRGKQGEGQVGKDKSNKGSKMQW